MTIPPDLAYTDEHEWALIDGSRAKVGITDYAQAQLGDVVYVELPRVGADVRSKAAFGVVESVKAASDLYSPFTGKVVEVNSRLESEPELVNTDPYGDGWMVVIELADPAEAGALLDATAYAQLAAAED
jgi:glycine cleavage system H protein